MKSQSAAHVFLPTTNEGQDVFPASEQFASSRSSTANLRITEGRGNPTILRARHERSTISVSVDLRYRA
jgi:hypothetical protein